LPISYTVSYYKSITDEHQLTLKRNAILEYLRKNSIASSFKELNGIKGDYADKHTVSELFQIVKNPIALVSLFQCEFEYSL
jgi:hypothetical protein